MKRGWHQATLESLCHVEYGTRVVKKQSAGTVYPVYGGGGATFFVDECNREDRLVVARFGMSEQCTRFVRGKFFLNDSGLTLSPRDNSLYSRFLDYHLVALNHDIYALGRGTAQKNLDVDGFRQLLLYRPPLAEQRRIVGILDEAFAGIARAVAATEKNLANARELFESTIDHMFSGNGESWSERLLGELSHLIDCLHKTPSYVEEGGYPMVRVTDVKGGVLNLTDARRVSEETFVEFSRRHTPKIGDIVLSRVGSYGVPAIVESPEPFCLGQNTVFVVPTDINSYLLYYFLLSSEGRRQIEAMVEGTTQPTISLKSIRRIQIPVPPESRQQRIVALLQSAVTETQRLESLYRRKLAALAELKQALLQKAFAGELTDRPETADRRLEDGAA